MNSLVTTSQEETRVEEEPWKNRFEILKTVCVHALLSTCINMQKYPYIKIRVAQNAHVEYSTVMGWGGRKSQWERPGSGLELAETLGTLRYGSEDLSLDVVVRYLFAWLRD